MNSETVDLIATDPPFYKGRDFHATPDSLSAGAKFQDRWSWERDVHPDCVDQLTDDCPMPNRGHRAGSLRALRRHGRVHVLHGRAAAGDAPGARTDRLDLPALQPHDLPPPQGRHGRDLWVAEIQERDRLVLSRHDVQVTAIQREARCPALLRTWGAHSMSSGATRCWRSTATVTTGGCRYMRSNGKRYYLKGGKPSDTVWDIPTLSPSHSEWIGWPTQRPITLYERIIQASSNEGDIVLDPFAGCATTPVAAERLGRRWIRMDTWDGATAAPYLRVKLRVPEPEGPRWSRAEMYAHLLDQHGPTCQGCDHTFDDPRYLELDHNTPRSDGGLNHVTNRILLCGPCNRLMSIQYTLSGLRRQNAKLGHLATGRGPQCSRSTTPTKGKSHFSHGRPCSRRKARRSPNSTACLWIRGRPRTLWLAYTGSWRARGATCHRCSYTRNKRCEYLCKCSTGSSFSIGIKCPTGDRPLRLLSPHLPSSVPRWAARWAQSASRSATACPAGQ